MSGRTLGLRPFRLVSSTLTSISRPGPTSAAMFSSPRHHARSSRALASTQYRLQHARYLGMSTTTASPSSSRSCPPLRILFCGSDHFSAVSLRALVDAQRTGSLPIERIEVVCRPPKRVGAGLKTLREVPVAETAADMGLRTFKLDTFRGWKYPSPSDSSSSPPATPGISDSAFNLVVAVSFGLLIPARIITAATYGGINVHPSLLPDFRGAAPIEWSMLAGCGQTGVSLQTLHPTKFDHGALLLQIPALLSPSESLDKVKADLAPVGADLLLRGLKSAVFVPPVAPLNPPTKYDDGSPVQQRMAPKITPEDRHVQWATWTSEYIMRRHRVLGPLWSDYPGAEVTQSKVQTHIKWSAGFELCEDEHETEQLLGDEHGEKAGDMFYHRKRIYIVTCDKKLLRTDACTISGKPERKAHEVAQILFKKVSTIPLA